MLKGAPLSVLALDSGGIFGTQMEEAGRPGALRCSQLCAEFPGQIGPLPKRQFASQ